VRIKPNVVIHACNSTYLEGRGRRIMVQGQPGQSQWDILPEKQTKKEKTGVWLKLYNTTQGPELNPSATKKGKREKKYELIY
jgi:hypothetical protein